MKEQRVKNDAICHTFRRFTNTEEGRVSEITHQLHRMLELARELYRSAHSSTKFLVNVLVRYMSKTNEYVSFKLITIVKSSWLID